MKIQIIQVPYDSGHESLRTGRGPDYFMQRGIDQILRDSGYQVDTYRITSHTAWKADIETTFELDRLIAEQVGFAIANNKFPFVLAGACNSCVGTLAGIGQEPVGLVWFEALLHNLTSAQNRGASSSNLRKAFLDLYSLWVHNLST